MRPAQNETIQSCTVALAIWFSALLATPRKRTRREFAEQELVIPEGKYKDTYFSLDTQPFMGLIVDEWDRGNWNRVSGTGCVQSGKSLLFFVLLILYHSCEIVEPVVVGAPTMSVCQSKWSKEIRPVFMASRFANLLPIRGKGSQGGWAEEIELRNGARVKFMSAGGGDEQRSSYTTRVVICTEVDKMDEAKESSRESDPVSNIEDRTLSYDDSERLVMQECTVSLEDGLIWRSYLAGTETRICCPCPHCGEYVTLERDDLQGWKDAENVIDARENAHFVCPECEGKIDDQQRDWMNRRGVLAHRGQVVERDGTVTGPVPPVDVFSVRWNAFNNLFWKIGSIAVKEWKAINQPDEEGEENNEKTLCQKYWAIPYHPPNIDLIPLSSEDCRKRTDKYPRGVVPNDTKFIVAGLDLGKWLCHYTAIAYRSNDRKLIIDYDVIEVDSDRLGIEKALPLALNEFRDLCKVGWGCENGGTMQAMQGWVDSGHWNDIVYGWLRTLSPEDRNRFRPIKGYSQLQKRDKMYRQPTKKTPDVRFIGDGYHFATQRAKGVVLVHINSDQAKFKLQEQLALPSDAPGACHVFHAPAHQHTKWSKHITAQKPKLVYDPELGEIIIMERVNRSDHYLDAGAYALKAGEFVADMKASQVAKPNAPTARNALLTANGQPYLVTER